MNTVASGTSVSNVAAMTEISVMLAHNTGFKHCVNWKERQAPSLYEVTAYEAVIPIARLARCGPVCITVPYGHIYYAATVSQQACN
jgi:hypothetical protein